MVVGEFPPVCGGIGNYVYNLSKALIDKGVDITVITRGNYKKTISFTKYENISVWKIRFFPLYPFHIKIHQIFLNKILSQYENKFDLIHLHNPLVPYPRTSLPVLVTEHGTVKGDIDNSMITDRSSFALKLFQKILVKQDYDIINNADLVTTVSNACMNEINNRDILEKSILVLGNGVDVDYFQPDEKNERYNDIILYTGRLDSRKGIMDLITCAKYVCNNKPEVKFFLTGNGPLINRIKNKIASLNLQDNVILTGYVNRNELLRLYQKSTIYVLPSYYEGLPTTLLEAMACGIPCIATDIEGNSEVITTEKTGFLVPPKNPEVLCKLILDLLIDPQKRKIIGDCGRQHVIETYDWRRIANNTANIYQSMLSNICH